MTDGLCYLHPVPLRPRGRRRRTQLAGILSRRYARNNRGYPCMGVCRVNPLGMRPGTYLVHRVVAAVCLGRRLRRGEVVHHMNHDKADFHPGNLATCTDAAHRFHHRHPLSNSRRPGERQRLVSCACGCGKRFLLFDSYGRPRAVVHGHRARVSHDPWRPRGLRCTQRPGSRTNQPARSPVCARLRHLCSASQSASRSQDRVRRAGFRLVRPQFCERPIRRRLPCGAPPGDRGPRCRLPGASYRCRTRPRMRL